MTGALCFLLFLAGALLAMLSGLSKKHRRGIEVTGHLVISASFFVYGIVSSHILRVAPQPVVTGQLVSIRPSRSRMDSNSFTVRPAGGGAILRLHSETFPHGVEPGDQVRVRYSEYDYGILEFDVLSGAAQGIVLRENDSAFYHVLFAFGGFLFLGTAYLAGRKRQPAVKPA